MTERVLPAAIEVMRQSGFLSLAWALEIESLYGQTLRYCGTSRDHVIEGDTYTAVPGMSVSSIANTLGMEVDNLKSTMGDNGDILQADVLDGLWDGAPYRLFLFNPLDPSDGIVPWHYGTVANIEPRIGAFDCEHRDWRQALHQNTTPTHQYACTYELGDARCKADLSNFTFAAVVTSVTNAYTFTCSGLAQAATFFSNGRLQFTLGANANGLSSQIWRRVRLHETGGVLTMQLPLVRPVSIGDEILIVAGCTHRPDEDCRDKFDNKVNYGGCDTKPLVREILEPGGA